MQVFVFALCTQFLLSLTFWHFSHRKVPQRSNHPRCGFSLFEFRSVGGGNRKNINQSSFAGIMYSNGLWRMMNNHQPTRTYGITVDHTQMSSRIKKAKKGKHTGTMVNFPQLLEASKFVMSLSL